MPRFLPGATALPILIGLVWMGLPASSAHAHGGGDHLAIGYYRGHDGTFEAPANPPWPPTLLVDTHPWELSSVFYHLTPVNSVFLQGWNSTSPAFEPLAPEDQEFDGHGFFSWLADDYDGGPVSVELHLDQIDAGLQILNPTTLQPQTFPTAIPSPHLHVLFFVDAAQNPQVNDVYTATFHLSDLNGSLADSEPFTVQFQIVPEPSALALLLAGMVLTGRRSGGAWRQ